MKEKMPAAIKRKALKQSAMLSKRGGFMTKFSNIDNDPDSKNIDNEFCKSRSPTEEGGLNLKKVVNFCDLVSLLINNPSLKKKVRQEKKKMSFLR